MVEVVEQAIRDGYTTPREVMERTGIKRPTPYFTRLENRGVIRKVGDISLDGLDRRGRHFSQHGYEWELVVGPENPTSEEREYREMLLVEERRRRNAMEKIRALRLRAIESRRRLKT